MPLRFPNFRQHVKNRSMWKGSMCIDDTKYWKLTDKVLYESTNMCSEALLKCLDEIIINAADQIVRTAENKVSDPKTKVVQSTTLEVRFDKKTGEITVYNDGPGFEVYDDHEELPKGMWTVQALITTERAGTNFDDMYGAAGVDDSVTGGVNGLGIKLIVIDSVKFTIETVDNVRNRYYYQEIYNGMENPDDIKPPTVIDLSTPNKLTMQQKKPHTTIRFIPDYNNLCRANENTRNKKVFTETDFEEFEKIVKFRIYQLSAFLISLKYRYASVGRVEYKNVNVYYNGEKINMTTEKLAELLGVDNCGSILLESEDDNIRFPWKITVGVKKDLQDESAPIKWGDAKNTNMSFLNGVYLSDGGSHVNYLNKQIFDYIMKNSKKADAEKITKNMVDKIIYIIDSIQIPKRLISFKSQSKTQVTIGTADLNVFKKKYVIPEEFLKKISKKIKQELAILIEDKNTTESTKTTNVKIRKYDAANGIHNKKNFGKRVLALPEGDSANKTIKDIIVDRELTDIIGTYNLQGVPPNAMKHIKRVARGGVEHLIKDKMLTSNVTFGGLIKILGLEYGMKNIDKRKLNYDSVLICTDQDSDGIGQICSLTLVFFLVFFPELVDTGFVKRLATPLIRVYTNKSDVIKFYREKDFAEWALKEFGGKDNIPSNYTVNYYKGLATHTPDEVLNDIGANFEENIYTFTYDDATQALLELAYGEDTNGRKEFLRSPVADEYEEEMYAKQKIKCSQQFSIEAKEYQLEVIKRKLKSAIDGFIPVQRKAFAGGRKSAQKHKVYQITGKVTESLSYHHGDKSMNDTIIKMAQNFTGGSNIPLFMPISNGFGDRRLGRDETGSARYLDTKLNTDIANVMFPPEDDWLLDYVYEDGQQAEPVFYIPVLPISILETTTTPAVGWKIDCWARDPKKVIENVRTMIEIDWSSESAFQPGGLLGNAWLKPGMRCVVDQYGKSSKAFTEICLGDYIIQDNIIQINQLPLRVWSTTFKDNLLGEDETKRKKYVVNVIDNTGNDITDVRIILEEGAIDKILEESDESRFIDPIETYFEIKQQMHMNLNLLNHDGCVTEFKTYEEILKYWYPFRKNLYIERIERNKVLLKIKVDYWKNTLRFINEDANKTINIDKDFTEEQRASILTQANYTKFNETLLFSPRYTKASELENLIYNTGNYKYIDKITIKDKSMKGIEKITETIKKLEAEYEEILHTKWQNVWLAEIDKLEKIIDKGIETKWLFGTKQYKYIKAKK